MHTLCTVNKQIGSHSCPLFKQSDRIEGFGKGSL